MLLRSGYDMTQIDDFLDVVLSDYTSPYKENAALKGKMRVLVDKIEEYRAVDEQMRKALYDAQVSARDIVAIAQTAADGNMHNANRTVEARIGDLRTQIEAEERRLQSAKQTCSDYAQRITTMLGKNIEAIHMIMEKTGSELVLPVTPSRSAVKQEVADSIHRAAAAGAHEQTERVLAEETRVLDILDDIVIPPSPEPVPEPVAASAQPIEPQRVVQTEDMETRFYQIDLSERPGEDSASQDESTDDEGDTARIYGGSIFTPKPRFNFSDLQFGPNYQDKNDKE